MQRCCLLLLWLALFPLSSVQAVERPAAKDSFEPADHYAVKNLRGWTVLVNKRLLGEQAGIGERVLHLLDQQLDQIERRLPGEATAKLRRVKIWVEYAEPHHPCMAYHPDGGWLRRHGMNPDKARCVELANAENFLSWTIQQPWMVLHELAHAYHDQFLPDGFGNRDIKTAYQAAMEGKLYQSVLRGNGSRGPHYAATNPMEYFAEATEAYFGTNDFYPFVRAELAEHDPKMYHLLGQLWGDRPPPNNKPADAKKTRDKR